MMNNPKAQVSFEFMVSIAIGMLVVLGLIVLFANKMSEVIQDSREQQITAILDIIDEEVTFAKGALTGYSRQFTLPISVDGENYSLNLTDGTIAIVYQGRDYTRGFSHRINGSLCLVALNETTRTFAVRKGTNTVTLSSCPDCIPNFDSCYSYDEQGICGDVGDLAEQCRERYCLCK